MEIETVEEVQEVQVAEFQNDYGTFTFNSSDAVPPHLRIRAYPRKWAEAIELISQNLHAPGDAVSTVCPSRKAAEALKGAVSSWSSGKRVTSAPFAPGMRGICYLESLNGSKKGPHKVYIELAKKKK